MCLDAKTGATVWATPVNPVGGGSGYSTPVKMTVGGIPTYVCLLGQQAGVVGVHATTGKLLWQYAGKGTTGGTAQIPTPVVYENKVFVSCSYGPTGGAALLELTASGKDKIDMKVVKAYGKPELNNHHGGMILVGKHVFFGHDQNRGVPACVDVTTGEIAFKDDREPQGMSGSAPGCGGALLKGAKATTGTLAMRPAPTVERITGTEGAAIDRQERVAAV